MPFNRDDLPSNIYWRRSEAFVVQRFYVAFCLFMSSVQDTFLSMMERERQNLNWSATCSYYGLVHGGRLLCFLSFGDFPTKHSDLREVFFTASQAREISCQLDWLSKFDREVAHRARSVPALHKYKATRSAFRSGILSYLNQLSIPDADAQLHRFGAILGNAAPLRNDSNYEALLIAHEFRHSMVSPDFEKLAEVMGRGAEESLPFLARALVAHVVGDSDFQPNRNEFEAFLRDYLIGRVFESIGQKLRIAQCDGLYGRLLEFIHTIALPPSAATYDRLEEMASYEVFGQKARLMQDFQNKIRCLERAIGGG
jgi:hypothetical protein